MIMVRQIFSMTFLWIIMLNAGWTCRTGERIPSSVMMTYWWFPSFATSRCTNQTMRILETKFLYLVFLAWNRSRTSHDAALDLVDVGHIEPVIYLLITFCFRLWACVMQMANNTAWWCSWPENACCPKSARSKAGRDSVYSSIYLHHPAIMAETVQTDMQRRASAKILGKVSSFRNPWQFVEI